jgi:uncharacterized membrane protein YgcG
MLEDSNLFKGGKSFCRMKVKSLGFVVVFIFVIGFVFAAQPFPHDFEGFIVSEDSSSSNAKTLIASVDGTITGSSKIVGNYYKITVVDNTGYGKVVKFFIGEEQASEVFDFEIFGDTITNLSFETIPNETIGKCGDGICDANTNECSFCGIDCPVSSCLNNGRCDVAIGEDFMTAPEDCVICGDGVCNGGESCSSCSSDCGSCNSGGGSGGGSSGGGSGGGSSVANNVSLLTQSSDAEEEGLEEFKSIEDINEIDEAGDESRNFISLITGAVVGGGMTSLFAVLGFVVVVLVLFFVVKKKKK